MGMYDTFVANCPSCGSEQDVQTKLFTNSLSEYRVGDPVPAQDEQYLRLKYDCLDCEKPLIAEFDMKEFPHRFKGFVNVSTQDSLHIKVEEPWGQFRKEM